MGTYSSVESALRTSMTSPEEQSADDVIFMTKVVSTTS